MARAISDEEQQLKKRARRRLIGAVVLVAAIVVVLPMVLDSEPKPSGQPITVQIPSPDSGGFTSKAVPPSPEPKSMPPQQPAVPEPSVADAKKPAPPPAPVAQATAPADERPAAAPEAPGPEAKVEKKPAEAEKPPLKKTDAAGKPKDGRYVVQVIALADAGKARQMQQKIAAAGIQSYTEVVKTAKGDVTRVRAGPFTTRKAADRAREQLKKIGLNGNVTAR